MSEMPRRVRTYVLGLDEILGGGLVEGSVTLLAGHPGAGKTTLAGQFVFNGLEAGDPCIYVGFDETADEFMGNMKLLGLDFRGFTDSGKIRFFDAMTVSSKSALEVVLDQVLKAISETGARRLVIDPINVVTNILSPEEIRAFIHNTLMRICRGSKITAVLTMDSPTKAESVGDGTLEFIVDGVISLEMSRYDNSVKRSLIVKKMRGVSTARSAYEFMIDKSGIRICLPPKPELVGPIERTRVSTGIRAMDEMLGGGLLKGTITLVSGASGTGKTMLALMFALRGVRNGERVAYLVYEEPPEQIRSRIQDLACDLGEFGDKDLKIIPCFDRAVTPGASIEMFQELYSTFNPSRVILDLGNLETQFLREEFMDVARSFALLSKSKKATVIVTSISNPIKGESSPLSAVADNIVALALERERDVMKRRILVLKERGSIHDERIRYIDFKEREVLIYDQ